MLEIEAKFYVRDFREMRTRLETLGAVLAEPRHHERNLRLDTPDGALSSARSVLRIREARRILLTFKRPLEGEVQREEIELEVSEVPATRALLERLGFQVIATYEKWRETYSLGHAHVMLDELPYGRFVEVEASSESALVQTVSQLGLEWGRRVRQTYLDLADRVCKQLGWETRELTFDRFRALPVPRPEELGVEVGLASRMT